MNNQKKVFLFFLLIGVGLLFAFVNQIDFAAHLQQKLNLFYQRHIPVALHLTFNQPRYTAGDTAYYRVDFFTADHQYPVEGRQIINVSLLDGMGNVLRDSRVLLKDGSASNQILLPSNLSPGRYSVVAYHEVMKNHDRSLFFQRPLWISGPTQFEEVATNTGLKFYPEGGNLVSGITNKVVMIGPPASDGNIFSADGQAVSTFRIDENGHGLFFITPKEGAAYVAEISGTDVRVNLPLAENDGLGMLITVPANGSPIRVTTQVPAHSPLRSEPLILAMTSHGSVYYTADISFKEKDFLIFALPQENLRGGIARFTVFRTDGTALAERLVYIKDPAAAQVEISLPKEEYAVREIIPFQIEVRNAGREPLSSRFSTTVYHDDLLQQHGGKSNLDNAVLFGDIDDTLSVSEEFLRHDQAGLATLDNYLITRQWRRYNWSDVWNETLPRHGFRKYLRLEGSAVKADGTPLPDSTRITFFLQKSVMVYEVFVGRDGRFDFSLLLDFYGEEEIFYYADNRGKFLPDVKVILDREESFGPALPVVRQTTTPDPLHDYSRQRKEIDRAYSFQLSKRTGATVTSLNALIEEEVFGADITVNLDDYLLLPTMSETLREIVPMLQHRRQRSRDIVKLFFDDRNRFAEDEPLFVIDGVITDNTTYFMNLKPNEVASIKVLNSAEKLQMFGGMGKNGMVLVETKIPGNAGRVPRSHYTFKAQGLTASSVNHPRTIRKPEHVPDLRTNIYWNPTMSTDSLGHVSANFRASDLPGRYRIKVEGFTQAGQPFSASKVFDVRFSPN